MAIGPQNNYPSLAEIANLVRALVNDNKKGITGTPGEGQILVNPVVANAAGTQVVNPQGVTLTSLMNSAIRETCRDIRIVGQPTLIKDNYILEGLTPVNSSLGVGVPNPAVQVSLSVLGYFDGLQTNSNLTLPSDFLFPLEMWERQNGTENNFGLMRQAEGALSPRHQVQAFGEWEWRTDMVWMNGATLERDIRLRYVAAYPSIATLNAIWDSLFVPIADSQEAIADKVVARYTARLGGDSLQYAIDKAKESILRLKQEVTKTRQMIDYTRPTFGSGKAGASGDPATFLY
jgi:hypothetical protein